MMWRSLHASDARDATKVGKFVGRRPALTGEIGVSESLHSDAL